MSPITVTQPTEDGQAPVLTISPKPDETDGTTGVWTMDRSVAEAFPTLTEALTAAGFTYVGVEEKAGKLKEGEHPQTLRYSRPDPEALLPPEEKDEPVQVGEPEAVPVQPAPETGEGVPDEDAAGETPGEGDEEEPAEEEVEPQPKSKKGKS